MNLLKTSRETLLKPLQAVAGIIERRHTLPILSNVLLAGDGGRLAFVATDIEIEISAAAAAEAQGADGKSLTVGARKLLDILRALPEGAEVTLAAADKRLQVRSGKSRFQLQTLPPEDFPRLAAPRARRSRSSSAEGSERAARAGAVRDGAAGHPLLPERCLLMVVDAGELRVVATDGHRLAVATKEVAARDVGRQEVILPRKTIIELTKLLGDTADPVTIELSASQARFRFDGVLLASKLVDGKFPDYQRVIPSAHTKQLQMSRQLLGQALQRAAILTSDKFRGVRWVLGDGSLRISCTNTEQEEAQEELDVDYKGEALDIGFNVQYLLDVLNNLAVEAVQVSLGDANSSALITVPGRDDFKYVVMPMRI